MFSQTTEDETLEKGPWFPREMKPEERRIVRNLVLAAKNGDVEVVKEILESGKVDVDSKYHWETALMVAARLNNVPLCELLLDFGADCEISRIMQQTPLWIAASYGNVEVMELLAASKKCSQANMDNSLRKCVIMNFLQGCDCLLRNGASPDATDNMGFTSLGVAAGCVENIDLRTKDNWRFQNQESWRLYHATNFETCELLIMWKADVNAKDNTNGTPMHYACEADNEEICRLLIENGADVNAIGGVVARTPLHVAIARDNTKIMKLLLSHDDILPNLLDEEGETPMMSAIQLHKQECVKTLLEDERWPTFMSVVTRREDNDDVINTPMREMIRQMPDMACLVMTKCVELSSQKDLKNPEFCARLNFAYLDDTYSSSFWNASRSTTDTMTTTFTEHPAPIPRPTLITTPASTLDRKVGLESSKPLTGKGPFRRKDTIVADKIPANSTKVSVPLCDSRCFSCFKSKLGCKLSRDAQPYSTQNRTLLNNHPLKIATQEKRYAVLCHPVAIALIDHKWKSIGRYWFYGALILYVAFVGLLNAHITISFRYAHPLNATGQQISESFYKTWKPIVSVVLFAFCVVAVIKLVFAGISDFPRCLWKFENWLNAAVYIVTVICVGEILHYQLKSFQLAAACIFAAWFNLLLTLREFPVIGIFFIMFTRILKNSIIVLIVFTPLMLAFGFTFSIITPTLPQFEPSMNLATVLVMLSGEMEYVDSLTPTGAKAVKNKGSAVTLYVLFTILMVICLLNLLVGLAVSDVDSLHSQAKAEMMSLKADMVIACEYYLSEVPRRRMACGCMTLFPNKARFRFRKDGKKIKFKHKIVSWFNIFGYSDTYVSPTSLVKATLQDRSESPTEILTREVSQLRSQLEILTATQRALKNESVVIKTPEIPGARILRKTFGIERALASSQRLASSRRLSQKSAVA